MLESQEYDIENDNLNYDDLEEVEGEKVFAPKSECMCSFNTSFIIFLCLYIQGCFFAFLKKLNISFLSIRFN